MKHQRHGKSWIGRSIAIVSLMIVILVILVSMLEFTHPEQLVIADSIIDDAHEKNIEYEVERDKVVMPESDFQQDPPKDTAEQSKEAVEEPISPIEGEDTSINEGTIDSKDDIVEGDGPMKPFALTFDDGPDAKWTFQILDILKEYGVTATFFVTGLQVEKFPEVLERIYAEGHAIGNHTFGHEDLTKLTASQIKQTIEKNDSAIFEVLQQKSTSFRAPYGAMNKSVRQVLDELDVKHTGWTVDTKDWMKNITSQSIVDNVKENAAPGGIVLQHSLGGDHIMETVKALPEIIEYLQEQGYTFVTVDELNSL